MQPTLYRLCLLLLLNLPLRAQIPSTLRADSWAQAQRQGVGTVTALWNGVDPFIFRGKTGQLAGVEYEVMEAFRAWLQRRYGVRLTVNWLEVPQFDELLPYVTTTRQPGVFGWAYFSITDQRRRAVRFTASYMPDLNVLVTNSRVPDFPTNATLEERLRNGEAYTMRNTTMADDVAQLRRRLGGVPLRVMENDYDILQQISRQPNAFGYLPLSLYIVALQNGLNVKRQPLLMTRREGFAGIFPLRSDWVGPVNEYFNSPEFRTLSDDLMRKYLGSQMSGLIEKTPLSDSMNGDVRLLKLEKEIVTQRFVDAALRVQQEKIYRNLFLLGLLALLGLSGALYARFRAKQKFNQKLAEQNELIRQQNGLIELTNRKLEMKVLQAQLNPHFIFNSLNAIQYFVTLDDKRAALRYISAFSRFLRNLLDGASASTTTVPQECRLLEQYLTLEQIRFPNKFRFEVRAEPGALPLELPALLIHPFVENALYHGVLNRPDAGGFLDVHFATDDGALLVTVTDNGIGREAARHLRQRKSGTDLTPHERLVKDRIALMNEQGETPILLEISDLAEGTRVLLQISGGDGGG